MGWEVRAAVRPGGRVGCWAVSEEQMERGLTAGVACQGVGVTVGAPADIPP